MEIKETQPTPATTSDLRPAVEKAGLGRDAFLRIFLAQLEHQDPLDPQDSAELGAQLAQFSQLEQSLRMTEELRGINTRLDQLIAASGSEGGFELDPMALIGRKVEREGNSLQLTDAGTSESLLINLAQEANKLLIELQDSFGAALGLAEVVAEDAEGNAVSLQRGTYELAFVEGEPRLRTPSGSELPLTFFALARGADGRLLPDHNQPVPLPPPSGMTYRFAPLGSNRSNGPFEPQITTSGAVEGLRIVNGQPVLSIAGQDVDPSRIIRIR